MANVNMSSALGDRKEFRKQVRVRIMLRRLEHVDVVMTHHNAGDERPVY